MNHRIVQPLATVFHVVDASFVVNSMSRTEGASRRTYASRCARRNTISVPRREASIVPGNTIGAPPSFTRRESRSQSSKPIRCRGQFFRLQRETKTSRTRCAGLALQRADVEAANLGRLVGQARLQETFRRLLDRRLHFVRLLGQPQDRSPHLRAELPFQDRSTATWRMRLRVRLWSALVAIGAIILADFCQPAFDLLAMDAQQGPHKRDPLRQRPRRFHAAKPGQPRPAQQMMQHRFDPVVRVVRHGNVGASQSAGRPFEELITDDSRGLLDIPSLGGSPVRNVGLLDARSEFAAVAKLAGPFGVLFGGAGTQTVVQMGRMKLDR